MKSVHINVLGKSAEPEWEKEKKKEKTTLCDEKIESGGRRPYMS